MIKRIFKNRKLYDLVNLKEPEVYLSIIIGVIITWIFFRIDLRGNISLFLNTISQLIVCICGAFIGLVGFSLSGIAFIIGLFQKKDIDLIENRNGIGIIAKLLSSYSFVAFVSAVNFIILSIVYFLLNSNLAIMSVCLFYIFTFLILYLVLFNIFYAVALVFNCVSLFEINRMYQSASDFSVYEKANEVRIEYLLNRVIKSEGIAKEDFIKELDNLMERYPDEVRISIMDYLKKYYGA